MPAASSTDLRRCIIGYGALGQNAERIGKALGMQVLIAERKGSSEIRPGRVAFDDTLKQGTIFIVVAPLDASTRGMIGSLELSMMSPSSLLVNVGRGGVVDESALADALKAHKIAGAAVDVFGHEPATKETSPLLDAAIPNLILSPHIAWYSTRTIKGTLITIKANIEGFVAGTPQNIIV